MKNISGQDAIQERRRRFEKYINTLSFRDSFIYQFSLEHLQKLRTSFGNRHLIGDGIEIGAQDKPLRITNRKARVRYVDRVSSADYEKLHGIKLDAAVNVDIMSEADDLGIITSHSLDFVICNHILEHIPDPISALLEWIRVLKPGGILYLSVPNHKSNEYDFERQVTSLEHIVKDYIHKTAEKKMEHWTEYIAKVRGIPQSDSAFEVVLKQFVDTDHRIHMHVFDYRLLIDILKYMRKHKICDLRVVDEFQFSHSYEILLIIKNARARLFLGSPMVFAGRIRNILILSYFFMLKIKRHAIRKLTRMFLHNKSK